MKKSIMIIVAVMLMIGSLSACSNAQNTNEKSGTINGNSKDKNDRIKIVTTIFPEYDWVRTIMGQKADEADLTMLLDNGVDLHSYQPSIDDILKISTCDLFVYVGGESDSWVKDALNQATNKNMEVINLLEVLGDKVKNEEIVEGMEHEHEHGKDDHDEDHDHDEDEDHDHDEDEDHEHDDHDHEHEEEVDEHVWLSLNNTITICDEITERIKKIDPSGSDIYQANVNTYKEKLLDLDAQYKLAVAEANVKTLLFGDRFPFRYLTDDYGLKYFAAFTGCSAETEASFETIIFLAGKVNELGLKTILTIESSDGKIAETIKSNTNTKDQKILVLNSMQGITSSDIKNGKSYLSVMTENLNTLKEALK
ncbi:MAG: metal ABC transporter substrate-binding protein [Lachnospiraceae bacterium]|nr:metal ABC transporter substrate-binding protein [Lachnospiraceae bacterium]